MALASTLHALNGAVLTATADGYTPADMAGDLAGAAPQVLGYIAIGVAAAVPIILAMIGINRGLGTFNKTAKKGG